MKIETLEVAGYRPALHGMRNPMDSWEKSDTAYEVGGFRTIDKNGITITDQVQDMCVGDADMDLSMRLQKAGPEHCKHLRMIMVWADITAPLYWWKQFDCYRAGVEKVSCSTMHKLMSREVTIDDFEHDELIEHIFENRILEPINMAIRTYSKEENPETKAQIFRGVVQYLPESYLQKRTVMMSYAALRNIYRQRKGHKLPEWQAFRDWAESLPESWMITDG